MEDGFAAWATLRESLQTVLADRRWPLKVALGGLFMLTGLGIILPQGFMIEHLDNSRRGFRTPMPIWRQFGDKSIMGLLALVFDFAYFVLPLLAATMLLFCAVFPLVLNSSATSSLGVWLVTSLMVCIWGAAFSLSLSPLAKVHFAKDGDMQAFLSLRGIRHVWGALNRRIYLQARIVTLPLYLPALSFGLGLNVQLRATPVSALWLLVWAWGLACSLFWAWLVVSQVYLRVAQVAEDREIDARLAARRAALNEER